MRNKQDSGEARLRLALQKSGRLFEESRRLIKECGIRFERADRKLLAKADNFPLELLYLRDDDIPECLMQGAADAGIVGENLLAEQASSLQIVERLGFSKCRLSLAVPRDMRYSGPEVLEGFTIATSYPRLLGEFIESSGISAEIRRISGSTEIAPAIRLADAVCDLVSSGSTLLSNGLKEVEVLFRSQAVLAQSPRCSADAKQLLEKFVFRARAVQRASGSKYILLNAPDRAVSAITQLLPGLRSPTVVPLREKGWSSMHSVIAENDFWQVIEQVREAGAEGILVVPIEKMIV